MVKNHMVNFLGATRTKNRAAYFKESSLSNVYNAKTGIANEKNKTWISCIKESDS